MSDENSSEPQHHIAPWHPSSDFRALARTSPNIIFVADSAGVTTYTNPMFQRHFGGAAGQLSEPCWHNLVHPDDHHKADLQQKWSSEGDHSREMELRLRQHDGTYRLHKVRGSFVADPPCVSGRWICVCTELGDLANGGPLDRVLSPLPEFPSLPVAMPDRIKTVLDALPLIVWESNPRGQIVQVNAAWWGAARGPVHSSPAFDDLIGPDSLRVFLEHWEYAVATGDLLDVTTMIDDRFEGIRLVRALAIPIADPLTLVPCRHWIGSFQELAQSGIEQAKCASPQPITPAICENDRPSVLVYFDDTSGGFGEPEVAHWHNGAWFVAGQPVDWPTHYLPLPNGVA
jgi:PAS domain S-box-containing protein